ncbi:MAG: hypothetical protein ACRCST_16995 [Turicibacter sp.]
MKKLLVSLSFVFGIIFLLTGCSSEERNYTKAEQELINLATTKIESEYGVQINKNLYTFGVAQQIEVDQYVTLPDGNLPEIIAVAAHPLNDITSFKKGDVLSYAIIYNAWTEEVISTHMTLY